MYWCCPGMFKSKAWMLPPTDSHTCQVCFTSTVGYGIIVDYSHHDLVCTKILSVQCLHFRIKEKHYPNSLFISNIKNIRFVINLCLF